MSIVKGRWEDQALSPSPHTCTYQRKQQVGQASKGTILMRKVEKNTALEHICEYVSVNVTSKKICLCINSKTDSTGKVFSRNIELPTVPFLLIYMSVTRLHYHYHHLFSLREKVKLINERNIHCHELLLHLFSNVPPKESSNTKRCSQVIQPMHYSKGKTYEHCHEAYAELLCPICPKFLQQTPYRQSSFEAVWHWLSSFQRETTILKRHCEKSVLGQALTAQHLMFSSCKTTNVIYTPCPH